MSATGSRIAAGPECQRGLLIVAIALQPGEVPVMTSDGETFPCPPWCTGEHRLLEDPEDGFLHSAPEAPEMTLAAAHGLHGGGQLPVQVLLCSRVPQLTAEPKPPVIEVCVDRHPGPEMTPGQARQLAAVLIELSDLAEVGQRGSTRSPGMVAGS